MVINLVLDTTRSVVGRPLFQVTVISALKWFVVLRLIQIFTQKTVSRRFEIFLFEKSVVIRLFDYDLLFEMNWEHLF